MCFKGGGGGDSSAQLRAQEEERQRRIAQGTQRVNAIFDGGARGVNPATAYDPNAVYYTATGERWSPMAQSYAMREVDTGQRQGESNDPVYRMERYLTGAAPAEQALPLISSGQLFTGVENSGGFDDAYYDGVAKAYLDYYLPQFEEQAGRARRSLILNSPTRQSSAFARRAGDLETDIGRQESGIRDQARGQANQKKAEVERNRADLLRLVEAGAGVESAGQQAATMADVLSKPAVYSPLGDLFARGTGMVANYAQARQQGYNPVRPLIFGGSSGKAPVTVVG